MNDTNFPSLAVLAITAAVIGHAPITAVTTMALVGLTQAPEPTVIQVHPAPAPTRVVIETCTNTAVANEFTRQAVGDVATWIPHLDTRLRALEDKHAEPYSGPLCDLEHIDCDVDPTEIPGEEVPSEPQPGPAPESESD